MSCFYWSLSSAIVCEHQKPDKLTFFGQNSKNMLKIGTFTENISRLKLNEFQYFQNKESFMLISIIFETTTFETKISIPSFFVLLKMHLISATKSGQWRFALKHQLNKLHRHGHSKFDVKFHYNEFEIKLDMGAQPSRMRAPWTPHPPTPTRCGREGKKS